MKRLMTIALFVLTGAAPAVATADPMTFKLVPNPSRATFKSDAPLETVIGNTAAGGIDGTLAVDPAKPQGATGTIRVDLTTVRTGIDKRDADMRGKDYLNTDVPENRWAVFEIKSVEVARPLEPGKDVPAKVSGVFTVRQRAVSRIADAIISYIKLTPEQAEGQKRFGFASDNLKVRAKFGTSFTDHGMQVPQLLFLKVANDIQLETDLTFARQ